MLIIAPTNIEISLGEAVYEMAGKVTVLAAIHLIAKKYLIREVVVKHEIAHALLTGHLLVRNQAGFQYQPPVCDLSVECISIEDLNTYFASHGHDYRLYPCDFSHDGFGVAANTGISPFTVPRCSVNEVRTQAIHNFLNSKGVDPMNIPWGGKKAIEKHLTQELKLCTPGGFAETWRAICGRYVRMAEHDMYARRPR